MKVKPGVRRPNALSYPRALEFQGGKTQGRWRQVYAFEDKREKVIIVPIPIVVIIKTDANCALRSHRSRVQIPAAPPTSQHHVGFLKLMQIQANHAISNVMEIYGIDREKTITKTITENIRGELKMREYPELTLARILNMYNYNLAIRDGSLPICRRWITALLV